MKSFRIKPYYIIFIGVLIAFLLSALSFPSSSASALATLETTPTITPDPRINPLVLESGNTQGLMIGAAVILAIILIGVMVQLLIARSEQNN